MSEHTLTIDKSCCIQCGTCIEICVQSVFEAAPSGEITTPALQNCIACGHCAAVCPTAAITFDGQDPRVQPELPSAPLDEKQRLVLFKGRRSTRQYTNEKVPRELITRSLEHARYAPTATNSQQVEWVLVDTRPHLDRIIKKVGAWAGSLGGRYARIGALVDAGKDPILRGAPALLLAHCNAKSPWGVHDASAAVSYLELAMHSYGLGTCWAGFVVAAAGQGVDLGFAVPEERSICAGLMFGFPVHFFARLPNRLPVRLEIVR